MVAAGPGIAPPPSLLSRAIAWIRAADFNLFMLVGVPGALGGFVTLLLGNNLSPAPGFDNWFWQLLISLVLGAIAGFVVVVVLTNTDRKDYARLFTLAFIAGLAYRPILNKGLETIGLSNEETGDVLSGQRHPFDFIQEIMERVSTLDEKTPQEEIDSTLEEIRDLGADLQAQLMRLQDNSGATYLTSLVPLLQDRLTVNLEVQVFEQLRSAGLQIEVEIEPEDVETDRFVSAAFSDVPDRLIDVPQDTEPASGALTIDDDMPYEFGGDSRSEHWLAIDIDYYAEYVINVYTEADEDLVAALYRGSDMELVVYSDDAGISLNPEIIQSLDSGRYYLLVMGYGGTSVGTATAEVSPRDRLIPNALTSATRLNLSGISFDEGVTQTFQPEGAALPYLIEFEISGDTTAAEGQSLIYELEFTGSNNTGDVDSLDLIAAIYDPTSRRLISYDDDSAGDFNPLLSAQLAAGTYLLYVSSFDSRPAREFTVTRLAADAAAE